MIHLFIIQYFNKNYKFGYNLYYFVDFWTKKLPTKSEILLAVIDSQYN